MSKLFAIKAYENEYSGMHGMEEFFVIEAKDINEARQEAHEASLEVINNYSCILDILEEEADNLYERDTEDWNSYFEQLQDEDTAYEIYEIVNETNNSLEHLNELFCNDPDEFINKYCKAVFE